VIIDIIVGNGFGKGCLTRFGQNTPILRNFKVEVPNKTYKGLYAPFDFRIKRFDKTKDRKFDLKLRDRDKVIYIENVDKALTKHPLLFNIQASKKRLNFPPNYPKMFLIQMRH